MPARRYSVGAFAKFGRVAYLGAAPLLAAHCWYRSTPRRPICEDGPRGELEPEAARIRFGPARRISAPLYRRWEGNGRDIKRAPCIPGAKLADFYGRARRVSGACAYGWIGGLGAWVAWAAHLRMLELVARQAPSRRISAYCCEIHGISRPLWGNLPK